MQASVLVGRAATLPAESGAVRDRWCLKLHGTARKPGSIVLTRRDYGVYAKEQAASEAVLQVRRPHTAATAGLRRPRDHANGP